MSNELATQMPEYLQEYLKNNEVPKDQFGQLDPADVGANFIKLVHGSSKEATPGWDGEQAPALQIGTMFLSRDHTIIEEGTPFIPLFRATKYIKWEGRPGDGRVVGMTSHRDDPRITQENGLAFGKDPNTGKPTPPIWTQYINFYVLVKQCMSEPVLLSFYRTSTPVGRRLTQDLVRMTGGSKVPLYFFKFKLDKPKIVRDGNNSWPQYIIKPDGLVSENLLPQMKKMLEAAKTMNDISEGVEFGALEDDSGKSKETMKDATPAPETTASTPAQETVITPPPQAPTVEAEAQKTTAAAAETDPNKLW